MEGVGIIVLDHVIVAGNQTYSMAQHGELLHPSEIMRAMVCGRRETIQKVKKQLPTSHWGRKLLALHDFQMRMRQGTSSWCR